MQVKMVCHYCNSFRHFSHTLEIPTNYDCYSNKVSTNILLQLSHELPPAVIFMLYTIFRKSIRENVRGNFD